MAKNNKTKRFSKVNVSWNDVWKVIAISAIALNFTTFKALIAQDSLELVAGAVGVAITTIGFTLFVFFKREL